MRQVTKEQFYATVGKLDVHPHPRQPDRTAWELRNRTVVGVSHPGYKPSSSPEAYFVDERFVTVG